MDLEPIRARLEAYQQHFDFNDEDEIEPYTVIEGDYSRADLFDGMADFSTLVATDLAFEEADLFAHAAGDIAALLAEVERLRRWRDRWKACAKRMRRQRDALRAQRGWRDVFEF